MQISKKIVATTMALVLTLGGVSSAGLITNRDTCISVSAENYQGVGVKGKYNKDLGKDVVLDMQHVDEWGIFSYYNIGISFIPGVNTTGMGYVIDDCLYSSLEKISAKDIPMTIDDESYGKLPVINLKGTFKSFTSLRSAEIPPIPWLYDTFVGCTSLQDVKLSDFTQQLCGTFQGCTSLKNFELPTNLDLIGANTFTGCTNLTEMTVPNTVTKVLDNAFSGCTGLKTLTVTSKTTEFGKDVFYNCPNLTIRCYPDSKAFSYAKANNIKVECIEHKYGDWKVTKEPTCSASGTKARVCECGKVESETIPALEHGYVKVKVVAPTTSSVGYTVYKCSRCGEVVWKDIKGKLTSGAVSASSIASATKISTKVYTGKQIKPAVKVTSKGKVLKLNRDYTIKYGSNKIGVGTVVITGRGSYKGKITKTFKIVPRKASVTLSSSKKKLTIKNTKRAEASKYQIQYSTYRNFKGAKIINTTATVKSVSAKSGKKYYVRSRVIKTVNGKNYVGSWSTVKAIKSK